MEDQQKIRYRLLNAALEKSDTIEQAVMATTGMLNFVITGRLDGEIPVQEKTEPEEQPVQVHEPAKRKPRSSSERRKRKKWKDGYLEELGARYWRKYLEAMIGLKETTQRITIQEAGQIALGKWHPEIQTAVSRYLIKHGYVEKHGGGRRIKWVILKNPDGTPYEPKTLKVPPAQAKGYGWPPKLGDIATAKQ